MLNHAKTYFLFIIQLDLCLVLLQVSKCFRLVQIFCARPKIYLHNVAVTNILFRQKDDLHSIKLVFVPAQCFWRGTKCSQIFGLAQKIWISTKHFGTCKRTRHEVFLKNTHYKIFCLPIKHFRAMVKLIELIRYPGRWKSTMYRLFWMRVARQIFHNYTVAMHLRATALILSQYFFSKGK